MIKKLIKYDIKNMTKILLYFYAITITLAGITRLINIGDHIQSIAIIGMIFAGLTYSGIINILINTFVHILRVFISSFYKDESYLTHTLPVTKKQLLLSKYISSLIVILCSTLACFLSLFIMFYSPEFIESLRIFINITVSGFNIPVGLFIVLIIAIIFAEICAIISMSFAAVIKGNSYNQKRLIKGLLWFAFYYFCSIIITVIIAVITFLISGNLQELTATVMSQQSFIAILIIGLITYLGYAILFYFINLKLFKKGVNVD